MTQRLDRLDARVARTLDLLGTLPRLDPLHPLPAGPGPRHRAALTAVLDALPADRADALIEAWGDRHLRAAFDDVHDDPALHALLRRPVADLPRLTTGLSALLTAVPSTVVPPALALTPAPRPGRPEGPLAALLAARPDALSLYAGTALHDCLPPPGLAPAQRQALRDRLDAGTPPEVLLDRALAPHLLGALCRGAPRAWGGGWPCWTLHEAAVAHLHRRCAPAHIFPDTPGGAVAGQRSAALLGAHLALLFGEEAVTALAATTTHPHAAWGADAGTALALADLQVWLRFGGAHLGPAWSSPDAWLKLLASLAGGPLAPQLRRLRPDDRVDPASAAALPDLLDAAAAIPWRDLPDWSLPAPQGAEDVLAAAVEAMFAEEVTLGALCAAPSDPPGARLTLDVASCALSAAPRAHHQYTEPSRAALPAGWCGALYRRGLRQLTLVGCTWDRRDATREALIALAHDAGPLPETLTREVGPPRGPRHVPTPPAALQVRPADALLLCGGGLASRAAARLRAAWFDVTTLPHGPLGDPLSLAAALTFVAGDAPWPHDTLSQGPEGWTARGHDPTRRFPSRLAGTAALDADLAAARRALRHQRTLLLSWDTAWVRRDPQGDVLPGAPGDELLTVDLVVQATEQALDAVAAVVGTPRVLLAVSPAPAPDRDPVDATASSAALLLAAHQLAAAGRVTVFPAWELLHLEWREPSWLDGTAPAPAAWDALYDRLLDVLVAPVARAWVRGFAQLTEDPDRAALREALGEHPFLPQPVPRPAQEAPTPTADVPERFDADSWPTALEAALRPGTFVGFDQLGGWTARLLGLVGLLPPPPEAPGLRVRLLHGLVAKAEELDDPQVLEALTADTVRALLAGGGWTVGELAPPLRFALTRRWLDDLGPAFADLDADRRAGLAEALAAGRPPRRGPPRTPMDRALAALGA